MRAPSLGTCLVIAALLLGACGDDDGSQNQNENTNQNSNDTPICGNGTVEGQEACDQGAQNSDVTPDACRTTCVLPRCGDGVIDQGEACDDGVGNQDDLPDACRTDCTPPSCGDGVVDPGAGESCDAGDGASHDGCHSDCALETASWTPASEFVTNGRASLAFDAARGELVLVGWTDLGPVTRQTWVGTARGFRARPSDSSAPGGVLVHDASSGRVLALSHEMWAWGGRRWTNVTPATMPPARDDAAVAFDAARGRIVLFGGRSGTALLGDTWEWDGETWQEHSPGVSPPARHLTAMAYDPVRSRVTLFGGQGATGALGDTWDWDGTDWTARTPASAPSPRSGHGLSLDPGRDRLLLFGGSGRETWAWDGTNWAQIQTLHAPGPRSLHGQAADLVRGTVVIHGGRTGESGMIDLGDTWEWDGTDWRSTRSRPEPSSREGSTAMTWDAARHRAVLLTMGEGPWMTTWEWTHLGWTDVSPLDQPPYRFDMPLAYEEARQQVVLFGGRNSTSVLGDTWIWDGSAWTEVTPATSPPARCNHQLAYDRARQRVVLFGGIDLGSVHFGDTWEWDGASWTEVVTAHTPGVRSLHAMAHDTARGRTVVFGGFNETWNQASGTWEYDGTDWTQASPATEPPTRLGAAMAYDAGAGGVVLLRGWGGEAGLEDYLMDQWVWDGSTWVSQPLGGLGPREGPALVATDWGLMTFGGFPDQIAVETCQSLSDDWYCESVPTTPGVDLLFGSGSLVHDPQRDVSILLTSEGQYTHRHWEWDGYAWHFRALLNVPPAANRGMANDPVRGVTVLFGGGYSMFGQPSDETHEFDGVEWVRRYPTTSPSARTTAMTYDAGRGVMLIFGGSGGGFLLDDTWEWDGTTWTERSPGTRPTARLTSLAYDPVRDVVVMFGGQGDNGTNLNDTWEWDGTTWTEHSPVIRPPARLGPLTYDPARGRVVLVGGSLWSGMGVTNLADVWEWDGSAWTQVATPTQPSSSGTLASYDLARREILRVGEETWAYRLDSDRPTEGCQGRDADGDGRVDCDDPDCQGRCAPLCVPGLAACDPAWPRCGDGVCSAVESCRLCAEDCGACPARCGDGFCEGGETDASCPGDCFAICGNGRCDAGEDCASCAGDCC